MLHADEIHRLFRILNPLSCWETRDQLEAFWKGELDSELDEVVREHLLLCDECSLAFFDLVEEKYDSGELPLREWPKEVSPTSLKLGARSAPAQERGKGKGESKAQQPVSTLSKGTLITIAKRSQTRIAKFVKSIFSPTHIPDREQAWRFVWKHGDVPARMLAAARTKHQRIKALKACMRGMKEAIEGLSSRTAITLDDFWPILEGFEVFGAIACLFSETRRLFAQLYADICVSAQNGVVRAAMAWGVNEFLERGKHSKEMGIDIAMILLNRGGEDIKNIILTLCEPELKPELKEGLQKRMGRKPLPSPGEEVTRVLVEANQTIEDIRRNLVRARDNGNQISVDLFKVPHLLNLMEWWHRTTVDQGILAMAGTKIVLKAACNEIKNLKRGRAISPQQASDLTQQLCQFMLGHVNRNPERPAFDAIEACEAIRDRAPRDCVLAMLSFLPEADPRVSQGIAVCIAEGYEEYEQDQPATVPWIRFSQELTGLWKCVPAKSTKSTPKHDLDIFFPGMLKLLNSSNRFDENAHWMNQRFDLHVLAA